MGNGQHRNRRGARPRPGSHKHGGAGNQGRATTQLIPPTTTVSASDDTAVASGADDDMDNYAPDAPASSASSRAETLISQEAAAPIHLERDDDQQDGEAQPAITATTTTTAPDHEAVGGSAGLADHEASLAGRGRFERFYAPGQRPRVERVTPPVTSAPATSASARRIERAENAGHVERAERPHAQQEPLDEDDGPEYTGPRGDVRGNVGGLVDSLRELFARDRAVASQGGVSRCGVCYLHFPASELIYREADGFYVCESCSHALGSSRVPMVRRQQRQ